MGTITPELAAALRAVLDDFLRLQDADPLDLRSIARQARVLPVMRGWEVLGAIRLDGVPVEVMYDPPHAISEIQDRPMALAILGTCAARYPSLVALRPTRPPNVPDCQLCKGSGRSDSSSDGLCLCGGLGWSPWSEGAA